MTDKKFSSEAMIWTRLYSAHSSGVDPEMNLIMWKRLP